MAKSPKTRIKNVFLVAILLLIGSLFVFGTNYFINSISKHTSISVQKALQTVNSSYTFNTPRFNITLSVINDEMGGNHGEWAISNYTKRITLYGISNSSYSANITINGTWSTFAGMPSPNKGVAEPHNGSGNWSLRYETILLFNGTILPSGGGNYSIDYGTNASDILKSKNATDEKDNNNPYIWVTYFFGQNALERIQNIKIANYYAILRFRNQSLIMQSHNGTENFTGDIIT